MATNVWDIPSTAQQVPSANRPKYAVDSPSGIWYPRMPILDQVVLLDLNTLGTNTLTDLLPSIPNTSYIVGPPSVFVINAATMALLGVNGALFGTILTVNGAQQANVFHPFGGGWTASPVYVKTQPGTKVQAINQAVAPGATGVASLWVPFSLAVAPV